MFEPSGHPRVFGLPPGVDFAAEVLSGLFARMDDAPPEALARVDIFVNTRRMQRRLKSLFDEGPARLLPRIHLITDLADKFALTDIPPPVPPLQRRLELTQLIAKLLEQEPELAPRAALFDLADSLADLMDEMRAEGVPPAVLRDLDVTDQSGHWARSLKFLTLVDTFFKADGAPDAEAQQRLVVELLRERWQDDPPQNPVLVAGSTGSRGPTFMFMKAVSQLPQGAVILPGLDFDMPPQVWDGMTDALDCEGHPQFRFLRLFRALDLSPSDVSRWTGVQPRNPARNRLISLALRPAPVTDQWMNEGPKLTGIADAADRMTLIEAPSSRAEAGAVALILRQAAEDGRRAALVTPDRVLTRQVTAALGRWGIVPDDSAGRPLPLSPPGRFLRQIAALAGQRLSTADLLALLKHPLANTGSGDRGPHLLNTRELELSLRRFGPPFPTPGALLDRAGEGDEARRDWAQWIAGIIARLGRGGARRLSDHLSDHISLAEDLAAGPSVSGSGSGELWLAAAGEEALKWVSALTLSADHGGVMSPSDYASLFSSVLQRGEVRETAIVHPDIMIWGTLEARVQDADLVILGGMNDGVWPGSATPDPWLNRILRHRANLLLPERRIGLSAHDFQQAIAADEVVITRSVRDAEAQTVPSRWINRLTNLLDGVAAEGRDGLEQMKKRGGYWLALAARLDEPQAHPGPRLRPAPRPSPRPPPDARPRELTITEIQTLIRDPYAVYARRVLGLRPLDPIQGMPDARTRGILLHKALEGFIRAAPVRDAETARHRLLQITDEVFDAGVHWPAAERIWRGKLLTVLDWFIQGEVERQEARTPAALESRGRFELPDLNFTLSGKIDRIDRAAGGGLVIYDYKTGTVPTKDQREHFDKQLMLAALIAERGIVDGVDATRVQEVAYVGLGSARVYDACPVEPGDISKTQAELVRLIAGYRSRDVGYTSRRAVAQRDFSGDYDHLARFGEWDESAPPDPAEVGV